MHHKKTAILGRLLVLIAMGLLFVILVAPMSGCSPKADDTGGDAVAADQNGGDEDVVADDEAIGDEDVDDDGEDINDDKDEDKDEEGDVDEDDNEEDDDDDGGLHRRNHGGDRDRERPGK